MEKIHYTDLNEIPIDPFDNKIVAVLSYKYNYCTDHWLKCYLHVHMAYYDKIIIVMHTNDYIFKYVENLHFVEEKSENKDNIEIDKNDKTLLIFNYDEDRDFDRSKYVHFPNLTIMYANYYTIRKGFRIEKDGMKFLKK